MRRIRTSRKIRTFGQWAVTTYGLECVELEYAIPKSRLWEDDWIQHMAGKRWVFITDFRNALMYARRIHAAARWGRTAA